MLYPKTTPVQKILPRPKYKMQGAVAKWLQCLTQAEDCEIDAGPCSLTEPQKEKMT